MLIIAQICFLKIDSLEIYKKSKTKTRLIGWVFELIFDEILTWRKPKLK